MPTYDYQCQKCGQKFEVFAKISDFSRHAECACGGSGKLLVSKPTYHPFPEGWWEHLDIDPIHISSKRQLRAECEKRGLSSVYLLDS